jgi:hypothetical protein
VSAPSHVDWLQLLSLLALFGHAARVDVGAPTVTVHRPSEPGLLHAWHGLDGSHDDSQQTPSTQLPVAHAIFVEQTRPFGTTHVPSWPGELQTPPSGQLADPQQTPFTHVSPPPHWLVLVHVAPSPSSGEQLPPLQK